MRTAHAAGRRRMRMGRPNSIQRVNEMSMWARLPMNLTTIGLEPEPAGVPTAPMRAPQATASMRARPKRLSPGLAPSSVRMASARGMMMALDAMAVTHIERKAPAARNPNMMRRLELPVMERTRRETRFPRPERTIAAARASTPIKKSTTSSPNPFFTMV